MSEEDDDITDNCEIDIYVLDENGNPLEGEEVTVFWGLWYGHESADTDDDGHATFWIPPNVIFDGRASSVEIHVKGEIFKYDEVECGNGYTINLSN